MAQTRKVQRATNEEIDDCFEKQILHAENKLC